MIAIMNELDSSQFGCLSYGKILALHTYADKTKNYGVSTEQRLRTNYAHPRHVDPPINIIIQGQSLSALLPWNSATIYIGIAR